MKTSFLSNEINVLLYFYIRNKSWLNDTAGGRTHFNVFQTWSIFNFIIINAENTTLHEYLLQNDRRIFRIIAEII